MRLRIRHDTSYAYGEPVALALQRLRLGPPRDASVRVEAWDVLLEGATRQAEFRDGFGNPCLLVKAKAGATRIVVRVEGEVETSASDGIVGSGKGDGVPLWLFRRRTALTAPGPLLRSLAEEGTRDRSAGDPRSLSALHALTRRVRERIAYRTRTTDVGTSAEAALSSGEGVCQDHAHAFCAVARLRGVPARYVSGYLRMDDRDEQDASHAWAEALVPDLGWVGFDVSNGYSPDTRYIRLGHGLDYRDAAPISGLTFGQQRETMSVAIRVVQAQSQQ